MYKISQSAIKAAAKVYSLCRQPPSEGATARNRGIHSSLNYQCGLLRCPPRSTIVVFDPLDLHSVELNIELVKLAGEETGRVYGDTSGFRVFVSVDFVVHLDFDVGRQMSRHLTGGIRSDNGRKRHG